MLINRAGKHNGRGCPTEWNESSGVRRSHGHVLVVRSVLIARQQRSGGHTKSLSVQKMVMKVVCTRRWYERTYHLYTRVMDKCMERDEERDMMQLY